MYWSLLLWLALILPGYVVVCRFWRDDAEAGLLGVIAVSYLATLGLLSPVSIACYLVAAPLWVFSCCCVLLILAAGMEITWFGRWRSLARLLSAATCLELAILAADWLIGARVGSLLAGDAVVHLARVRSLLDQGFNNFDPFLGAPFFFPIYHTNLHHALLATCSQISGIDHLSVWVAALPWAKLLIVCGAYYLTWRAVESTRAAWSAAVFVVAWQGPVDFVLYPNKLAPLFVVPCMIGFALQSCAPRPNRWVPIKLAVAALVLGQIHALYAGFVIVALGPVLSAAAIVFAALRSAAAFRVALCVAALTAGAPFLAVARTAASLPEEVEMEQLDEEDAEPTFDEPAEVEQTADAEELEDEQDTAAVNRMSPRAGWGTFDWRTVLLLAGLLGAVRASGTRNAALIVGAAAVTASFFYIPPLYTRALDVLEQRWILSRMGFVLDLTFISVGVGGTSVGLFRRFERRRRAADERDGAERRQARTFMIRSGLRLVTIVAVAALGAIFPRRPANSPYTWSRYLQKARAPANRMVLQRAEKMRPFLEAYIQPGETVLAPPWQGMVLAMVHDCRIVVPRRGSVGVPDLQQRREDLHLMLSPDTPWPKRRELLIKYGVRYYIPARSPIGWARRRADSVHALGPLIVFSFDL